MDGDTSNKLMKCHNLISLLSAISQSIS